MWSQPQLNMVDEIFTHTFELDFGADGGQFLHGQIEFNVDGEVSFKIEESSIPLSKEAMQKFMDLCDVCQEVFYKLDGIKNIEIKQKPTP